MRSSQLAIVLGLCMVGWLAASIPHARAQSIASQPVDPAARAAFLERPSGELEFLGDRLDLEQLAIAGHSQGGCLTATLSTLPNVKLVISISSSQPTSPGPALESILYVAGLDDTMIDCDYLSCAARGALRDAPPRPVVWDCCRLSRMITMIAKTSDTLFQNAAGLRSSNGRRLRARKALFGWRRS
jgi:pimeloyl-ACP methyl ester carboxylesterase